MNSPAQSGSPSAGALAAPAAEPLPEIRETLRAGHLPLPSLWLGSSLPAGRLGSVIGAADPKGPVPTPVSSGRFLPRTLHLSREVITLPSCLIEPSRQGGADPVAPCEGLSGRGVRKASNRGLRPGRTPGPGSRGMWFRPVFAQRFLAPFHGYLSTKAFETCVCRAGEDSHKLTG